jgi:hypothetical protein
MRLTLNKQELDQIEKAYHGESGADAANVRLLIDHIQALEFDGSARCLVTGNPIGTDTRPISDPCKCFNCDRSAWLKEKIAPIEGHLRAGARMVESAYAHVSHGGPTREEAAAWVKKADELLAALEKVRTRGMSQPQCFHKEINNEGFCKNCGAKASVWLPITQDETGRLVDMRKVPNASTETETFTRAEADKLVAEIHQSYQTDEAWLRHEAAMSERNEKRVAEARLEEADGWDEAIRLLNDIGLFDFASKRMAILHAAVNQANKVYGKCRLNSKPHECSTCCIDWNPSTDSQPTATASNWETVGGASTGEQDGGEK